MTETMSEREERYLTVYAFAILLCMVTVGALYLVEAVQGTVNFITWHFVAIVALIACAYIVKIRSEDIG